MIPDRSVVDANGVARILYSSDPGLVMTIPPAGYSAATASITLNNDLNIHISDRGRAQARSGQAQPGGRVKVLESIARARVAPAFCVRSIDATRGPIALQLSVRTIELAQFKTATGAPPIRTS